MTTKTKNKRNIVGIVVIIMGLIFATIGGGFTVFSYTFSQTALATSGVVTDIEVNWSSSSNSSSSSPTYKPTISYFDQNGAEQSAQTFLSSSGYNYRIGTKLQILYNPEDPSSIRIDSWFALWGFGLIFFVVGLLTMCGGVVLFFFANRGKNQPKESRAKTRRPKRPDYSYSSSDQYEKRPPTVRRK